uniref:Uncharacterized protein n=1 Tax=Octopus bimaculoides TaxID=37653 RepID=A0A0L8HM55_OCTBM
MIGISYEVCREILTENLNSLRNLFLPSSAVYGKKRF